MHANPSSYSSSSLGNPRMNNNSNNNFLKRKRWEENKVELRKESIWQSINDGMEQTINLKSIVSIWFNSWDPNIQTPYVSPIFISYQNNSGLFESSIRFKQKISDHFALISQIALYKFRRTETYIELGHSVLVQPAITKHFNFFIKVVAKFPNITLYTSINLIIIHIHQLNNFFLLWITQNKNDIAK